MLVYISHSRQNSSAALRLCDELERRGVRTWLDVRALESGSNWNEQVTEAIESADAFVFFIGPPGPNDQWQKFEWQKIADHEYFLDPSKSLVPVIIGEAEIPGFLTTRVAIQVADGSPIDFQAIADSVINALSKPSDTIDPDKLGRSLAARERALKNLREYSQSLEEDEVKRAALRSLK